MGLTLISTLRFNLFWRDRGLDVFGPDRQLYSRFPDEWAEEAAGVASSPTGLRRHHPEVNFIDDGAGKPMGINQQIGRVPIRARG